MMQHRYFIVHKPCGMLSQFVNPLPDHLLGDLAFDFPEGTHAIGRLDKNSEGLLLLTTNKKITKLLFCSGTKHERTYFVKLRYQLSVESLNALRNGVSIRLSGDEYYLTPPCDVQLVDDPLIACPYGIEEVAPYCWISITLTEGKFRQVRKMCAAVRHRVLQLVRTRIEDIHLDGLQAGGVREVSEEEFFSLLKLGPPQ